MPPLWDWHCAEYLIRHKLSGPRDRPCEGGGTITGMTKGLLRLITATQHTHVSLKAVSALASSQLPPLHRLIYMEHSDHPHLCLGLSIDHWSSACLPGKAYMSVTMRPSFPPHTQGRCFSSLCAQ